LLKDRTQYKEPRTIVRGPRARTTLAIVETPCWLWVQNAAYFTEKFAAMQRNFQQKTGFLEPGRFPDLKDI
jgi:hypothetical protein